MLISGIWSYSSDNSFIVDRDVPARCLIGTLFFIFFDSATIDFDLFGSISLSAISITAKFLPTSLSS